MSIIEYEFKPKVKGYFRFEACNALTGERRVVADWFPNLITNAGLEAMGTTGIQSWCMVGAGNDIPSIFDTTLKFRIASTSTIQARVNSARSSPPYYGVSTITYRFAAGAAAGNLSEVGIGWSTTNCFSRALILDANGDPTTITILANEFLDVIYELRSYPPLADDIFNVNLSGTNHQVTVRAAAVTDQVWAPQLTEAVQFYATTSVTAYSGPIGAITGNPSGSAITITPTNNAYQAGSLTKTAYSVFGLDQANYVGGIRSLRVYTYFQVGLYQMEFNPPIPKDNTRTWRVDYGVTWARNE